MDAPNVGGYTFASWVIAGTDTKWNLYNTMPDRNLVLVATYNQNRKVPTQGAPATNKPLAISSPNTNSNITGGNSQTSGTGEVGQTSGISGTSNSSTQSLTSPTTNLETQGSATSKGIITSANKTISDNSTVKDSGITVDRKTTWSLLSMILTILSVILSVALLL